MLIIIIRSVLLYILIVFALRLMGKKTACSVTALRACNDNTYIQYRHVVARGFDRPDDIRSYPDTDDSLHGCFHVFYYAQEFTLPPPCDRHTSDNHYRRHNRPQGYEAPSLQR